MAIEYQLTLAGNTPTRIAERGFPDLDDRPTGTARLLTADLYGKCGFEIFVRAGQNGYLDFESDTGIWEWEPATYVAVTFRMEKNAGSDRALLNMLTVVRRVLDTGHEDAALDLNGNWLLLTRFNDELVKHRRTWWNHYAGTNDYLPE